MELMSDAFDNAGVIPIEYTCDGEDINPPFRIIDVPAKAVSLALIMDDPDVPTSVRSDRMWVHWVIFNMPPDTKEIPENSKPPGTLGAGTDRLGYQGPCPPDREHRYFFKLYALDIKLPLKEGATKADLERSMKDHILTQSQLMGRYNRKK